MYLIIETLEALELKLPYNQKISCKLTVLIIAQSLLVILIRLQCRHNDLIRGDISWDVSYAPEKISDFSVLNC